MRKVILFNLTSVDGFFAGPNGDIEWHKTDDEFNNFAIEQLNTTDGLIFGRVTYEMMASFWPTPLALETDPIIAKKMNSLPKIAASHTLKSADWINTRLVRDIVGEITKVKQQPGRDLFIFGSANLSATLTQHNLIDEYRIIVNPVILGSGLPLFQGVHQPLSLKLDRTRIFGNGNILLVYHPEGKAG